LNNKPSTCFVQTPSANCQSESLEGHKVAAPQQWPTTRRSETSHWPTWWGRV